MQLAPAVRRVILGSLVLLATSGGAAPPAEATGSKANVQVRIVGTSRTGRSGVAESAAVKTIDVGQAAVIGVAADFDGAMASGGWPVGGAGSMAWRVDARLLSVSFENVELSVTWRRHTPAGSGAEGVEHGDTRVLRLSRGQRHVLDFVASDGEASDLVNVFVEVSADRAPDEQPAQIMEYDFWLVHESRTGQKTTLHQSYGSYDIAKAAFAPLPFGLDGTVSPKGAIGPVAVEVTGTLTGRLRPEGGVEVTLGTEAWLRCGKGRSGGGGVKEFVANEGETVSVELPASFGQCLVPGVAAVPPGARPGLAPVPGGLRLLSREFFEGDRFSLLVRVRRFERPPR